MAGAAMRAAPDPNVLVSAVLSQGGGPAALLRTPKPSEPQPAPETARPNTHNSNGSETTTTTTWTTTPTHTRPAPTSAAAADPPPLALAVPTVEIHFPKASEQPGDRAGPVGDPLGRAPGPPLPGG